MRGTLKLLLKIFGIIIGIIALVWMGIAAYVNTHKQEMLTLITRVINQNLNGKVTIESIEPALIK